MQGDNRTVIVPMDHGVTVGPIQGITNMQQTINQLLKGGADAILVHKGIAKHVDSNGTGLIVMLSGMSNLSPNVNAKSKYVASKKPYVLALTQFLYTLTSAHKTKIKCSQNMGKVADECDQLWNAPSCDDVSPGTKNPK